MSLSVEVWSNIPRDDLPGALADISELFGVPAEEGGRVLLDSAEPPVNVHINIVEILGIIASLLTIGDFCARLYKKLRARIKNRGLGIMLTVRDERHSITYVVGPSTPNEAVAKIAKDCDREVKGDGRMRSYIDEGWMTVEEYYALRKRQAEELEREDD